MIREPADFDSRWYNAVIPSNHWHFHRRLLDRYGLVLGPGEFSAIQRAIVTGRAERIRRRQRASIYWVELKSAKTHIAVVARGRTLLTVLPVTRKIRRWIDLIGLPESPDRAHAGIGEEEASP